MPEQGGSFKTKELSKRTWPDFERLFSQGNGWDHCWCMAYQGGNKSGPRRAQRSAINRAEKARLVDNGRAHGILVYAGRGPIGWCQFGPQGELPVADDGSPAELFAEGAERRWRITCFVTHKDWQHKGVARIALSAALAAIAGYGGGLVEAYPFAHTSDDVNEDEEVAGEFAELVRRHGRDSSEVKAAWIRRKGKVTYAKGKPALVELVVDGVGPVNALCRWWRPAFHVGTVAMFELEGFKAVGKVQPSRRRKNTDGGDAQPFEPTRLVMQKAVRKRTRP